MTYGLLALAALMFGLYNIFIKLSAEHIQPVLGAVILQFVAKVRAKRTPGCRASEASARFSSGRTISRPARAAAQQRG